MQMKDGEGGLLAKRIHGAKGKKTLHLCEMKTKTNSHPVVPYKRWDIGYVITRCRVTSD